MGHQFLPMKHEQQLVTSTTYYKSFRVLFLRGVSCYHITGAHLGTTNVSVSRTGFFHGPGWWRPSPPCWGSWVCHGSWLAIKKKKMSGGLYNSTIKKLCPQSRCGREDKCGLSCCMSPVRTYTWETTAASHSQEQIMARPDGNRYLQEAHQQLTVENTHIRSAWREETGASYTLSTPPEGRQKALPPASAWTAECPQGLPRTLSGDYLCAHRFAFKYTLIFLLKFSP